MLSLQEAHLWGRGMGARVSVQLPAAAWRAATRPHSGSLGSVNHVGGAVVRKPASIRLSRQDKTRHARQHIILKTSERGATNSVAPPPKTDDEVTRTGGV